MLDGAAGLDDPLPAAASFGASGSSCTSLHHAACTAAHWMVIPRIWPPDARGQSREARSTC